MLALLRSDVAGICVSSVPLDLGYTLRNRIGELRAEGHNIESFTCHVHAHRAPVARYVLTGETK